MILDAEERYKLQQRGLLYLRREYQKRERMVLIAHQNFLTIFTL